MTFSTTVALEAEESRLIFVSSQRRGSGSRGDLLPNYQNQLSSQMAFLSVFAASIGQETLPSRTSPSPFKGDDFDLYFRIDSLPHATATSFTSMILHSDGLKNDTGTPQRRSPSNRTRQWFYFRVSNLANPAALSCSSFLALDAKAGLAEKPATS